LRSELKRGAVRVVGLPRQANGLPQEALIVLDPTGDPKAYVNRCQHLPIPLDGGSGKFYGRDPELLVCWTHGARYRAGDGACVDGPCGGRGLERLTLELEGDAMIIVW
jgi:nitrite reductase/ring-hydroxylating ferredoxin subunit